jgi:hypothetical protein
MTTATPTVLASTAPAAAAAATRHDTYVHIHKGLRSFMMDTLMKVGRLDGSDSAEVEATLGQLDALLGFCAAHLGHENEFIHPAIEARCAGASERIADEHVEHLASIAELKQEADALRGAEASRRAAAALRLYRQLALFVAENFQHMHHEETAHNAALWAHYSDAELLQLHARLVDSLAPDELLLSGRWMVPAMNPDERAEMINGMKSQMPPEAFLHVLGTLRPHLEGAGWSKLMRDIGLAGQPGRITP